MYEGEVVKPKMAEEMKQSEHEGEGSAWNHMGSWTLRAALLHLARAEGSVFAQQQFVTPQTPRAELSPSACAARDACNAMESCREKFSIWQVKNR